MTYSNQTLCIVTGTSPDPLVAFAATELQRYVNRLFGIEAEICLEPQTASNLVFLEPRDCGMESPRDEQSFILRSLNWKGRSTLLVAGGSPVATLWAVYELVERWGVRYLLHGDVFPENPSPFHLPTIDRTFLPNLRTRCWRLINVFACGPESWGLEENKRFIDQLAKLKFTEVFLAIWPWQSFVHHAFRDVKKRTATSFWGEHLAIEPDDIGRDLFGDMKEFENPDLAGITDYDDRHQAAKRLAKGIMDHAQQRGMTSSIGAWVLEYPSEFRAALPGAEVALQVGNLTCRPSARHNPNDPLLVDLVRTMIRDTVGTYPEADSLIINEPEHREWMEHFDAAWKRLNEKYALSKVKTIESALEEAGRRILVHGGSEREVGRVKGDIVMLDLLDRVFEDQRIVERPGRPPIRVIYTALADELLPFAATLHICGLQLFIDYTARRVVDQIETLDLAPTKQIRCRQIFTLADDNIGLLPQLATQPLHKLAQRIRELDFDGFSTRHWTIGDLDPTVQYLARSCWDANVTAQFAHYDLAEPLCGPQAATLLVEAWQVLEEITDGLDRHGMGFAFPIPQMMTQHWDTGEHMPRAFVEFRTQYQKAQLLAEQAAELSWPAGQRFAQYHATRMRFAVEYLYAVEAVCEGGVADKQRRFRDAENCLEQAIVSIVAALQAYVSIASDNCDRGAIAIMNNYCYRALKSKLAELRTTRLQDAGLALEKP